MKIRIDTYKLGLHFRIFELKDDERDNASKVFRLFVSLYNIAGVKVTS